MSTKPDHELDWAAVQSVFREALHLPPGERTAFVAERFPGDPEAQQRLADMFASHEEDTWDIRNSDLLPPPAAEVEPATVGQQIGPYTLREVLGSGGFAVVYRAEQTRPIHRDVALKIIKVGMDTRELLSRFDTERKTLALMNHPNVAHVYDAGMMESGRPYLAMEYVDGVPLTAMCKEQSLNLDARLGLFLQVCAAVQHAHQKGVIHRDLKPSNILVAQGDDGTPLVKVIDFGIAKALSGGHDDVTAQTMHGQIIGTLRYMSPEQLEGRTADIDTRTDVYSLGVVLYEVVTHELPYGGHTTASRLDEFRSLVEGTDPMRPSDRLSRASRAAQAGDDSPSPVPARSVRRELDWIILRALERDRDRRYQSVADLARDIERYLRDEPVAARPASAAYRFGKFARRHRAVVIGGSLIILALISGTIATAIQARRADAAHEQAVREATVAGAVTVFLRETFSSADETEILSAIDAARPRIDAIADFEVRALVRSIVGRIYMSGGAYADAEEQLNAALTAARSLYGRTDLRYLAIEYDLARTHVALGQPDLAEPYLLHITSASQSVQMPPDQVIDAFVNLIDCLAALGRFDEGVAAAASAKSHPASSACSPEATAALRDAERAASQRRQ